MDRIAIIADVHGNIPALEAVLEDAMKRGIDRVFCLGDLVGKGPEPDAAVDTCRRACEQVIKGNWDASIAREDPANPFPAALRKHVGWHRQKLGEARLEYLDSLPGAIDFLMSGKRVRLVHASPQGVYHRVFHNDAEEKLMGMFDDTEFTGTGFGPDAVGYADIHYPYRREFGDRLLFNVGSVGNPLDRPLACYQVMEGEYGNMQPAPFSMSLVRLEYDIETAVRTARDSGMPDVEQWEDELRYCRYRGHK